MQILFIVSFFFFQAEDGIRDGHVTGVQTCALPISLRRIRNPTRRRLHLWLLAHRHDRRPVAILQAGIQCRSEERRVGKESKTGRGTEQDKQTGEREGAPTRERTEDERNDTGRSYER